MQNRFDSQHLWECRAVLDEMAGAGLTRIEDGTVKLTPKGMLLSNEVFQRLIGLKQ